MVFNIRSVFGDHPKNFGIYSEICSMKHLSKEPVLGNLYPKNKQKKKLNQVSKQHIAHTTKLHLGKTRHCTTPLLGRTFPLYALFGTLQV